jgi:uncharacterized membrane protein YoaK (UPF0700 family)
MLHSFGSARTTGADRRLAASLAFVAGALNAVGFWTVGFFAANMTGNVSSASVSFAMGNILAAGSYLGIVVAFVLGAASSTLSTEFCRRRGARSPHAWIVAGEAVLLGLLGLADSKISGIHAGPVFVVSLSFLMGLQNATVTRISAARVRTTHVSGMLTDIGIECAELFARAAPTRLIGPPELGTADTKTNLLLHLQTVLSFLAGGVVGVVLYARIGGLLLILTAMLLASLSIPSIARGKDAGPRAELEPQG